MIEKTKQPLNVRIKRAFRKDWQLFLMCLLPVIYFIVFHYLPMYGVQIAFKDFQASKGIWGSSWVGFKYFKRFFESYQFWPLIKNTLSLSLLQILIGFPIPILLAILLNQMKNQKFRQFVQTVTYCPHFISIVVLTGMLYIFLSPRTGLINNLITSLGGDANFFWDSLNGSGRFLYCQGMAKCWMERYYLYCCTGRDQPGFIRSSQNGWSK